MNLASVSASGATNVITGFPDLVSLSSSHAMHMYFSVKNGGYRTPVARNLWSSGVPARSSGVAARAPFTTITSPPPAGVACR